MRTGAQRRVLEIPCSAALINHTNSPKSDRRRPWCQLPVFHCQCTLRSLAHSSQVVRSDLRLDDVGCWALLHASCRSSSRRVWLRAAATAVRRVSPHGDVRHT